MKTATARWATGITALAVLTAASLATITAPAGAQATTTIVDHGHVDLLAPVITDGALHLSFKDGTTTPPVFRDPEQVVTHVKPESRIQVPDLPEYAFLGPVGSDLWLIPETQDPALVWAGWNTESLSAEQVDPASVTWTLQAVGGDIPGSAAPGTMTIFQSGPFGEPLPRVFDTNQPLPQRYPLALGTHAHANWTFSAEGVYRLTFTVDATTPTGAPLHDTATYTLAIGDIDPTTVDPGTGPVPTTTSTTTTTNAATTTTMPTSTTTSATTTTTGAPSTCVVLDDGHVDLIAPRLLDGALRTQVKDGTAGPDHIAWREPADVILHVVPAARNSVPADPAYAFLGTAGTPVWLIPQTQVPGIVWAGWNTESLTPQDFTGTTTIRLSQVDGPGRAAVFLTALTPEILVDSNDGLPDDITAPLGTHAHANWAFTAEGVYRITVEVTATRTDGSTLTDTDVFTIAVGDVDPASAAGRNCSPPTNTSSPTNTTTPPSDNTPTPTNPGPSAPGPTSNSLAHTGVGSTGTAVALAVLLIIGGTAGLVLGGVGARCRTARTHVGHSADVVGSRRVCGRGVRGGRS